MAHQMLLSVPPPERWSDVRFVAAAISSAGNHSLAWAVALWIAAVSWAVNASRVTPSCNQTPLRLDD